MKCMKYDVEAPRPINKFHVFCQSSLPNGINQLFGDILFED